MCEEFEKVFELKIVFGGRLFVGMLMFGVEGIKNVISIFEDVCKVDL